ncbi:MAG: tetratricopeptide repeat protein [Bacteroidetes bacterium]|nr:tetratricopeptide repeat protein [Bacteroidota bacterium]
MKPKKIHLNLILFFLILLLGFHNTSAQSVSNNVHYKKAIHNLATLMPLNATAIKLLVGNQTYSHVTVLGISNEIKVLENSIEFIFKDAKNITTQTAKIYFNEILEEKIKPKQVTGSNDYGSPIIENHLKLGTISLVVTNEHSFLINNIARELKSIQTVLNEDRFKMDEFKETALAYQLLKEKPSITETQRKYIVQANAFTSIMDYEEAINSYIKVLEINSTAYPDAYFNLALLLGQNNRFYAAINFMEKYLLLVPNSAVIDKAKEKIVDWEIMLNN